MKTIYIILLSIALLSCKNKSNTGSTVETTTSVSTKQTTNKQSKKGTYLCKINDEDWSYTKASGIVSKGKNSDFRRAIVTFKNKLSKGSESVQIEYNATKNEVIRVLVNIKRPNKEGKLIGATYTLHLDTLDRNPETNMSGTIDLSNPKTASGTATFTVENKYEKTLLKNAEDILIHITDLNFSGVGYSDINREFDKYKK